MLQVKTKTCVKCGLVIIFFLSFLGFFVPQKYLQDLEHPPQCFFTSENQLNQIDLQNDTSRLKLLEDVFEAKLQPKPERSIFFIDTTCKVPPKREKLIWDVLLDNLKPLQIIPANLTYREACAVESAALHNPGLDVFVLFTKVAYQYSDSNKKVWDALLSYPNVYLRSLDLWNFVTNTPIDGWLEKGSLFTSPFLVEHTSDLLRLLVLWRWGGIYLDTDFIILRSLMKISSNFACAESNVRVASAAISFTTQGYGHSILHLILNDFQKNYNPKKWAFNGPQLVTRTLKKLCEVTTVSGMFDGKCKGIQVFRPNAFYPIRARKWKTIFEDKVTESMLNSINESYSVHLWNRYSKSYELGQGNPESLYNELASKNCPKIYAIANGSH